MEKLSSEGKNHGGLPVYVTGLACKKVVKNNI